MSVLLSRPVVVSLGYTSPTNPKLDDMQSQVAVFTPIISNV